MKDKTSGCGKRAQIFRSLYGHFNQTTWRHAPQEDIKVLFSLLFIM
jgi:hypothetical protein